MVAGKRASSMVAVASSAHPPTTNPVLDEMMAALSLSTTTITTTVAAAASNSMVPCFHGSGSTSNRFSDGRAYRDVIQEFLAVPKEKGWRVTFEQDHKEYCIDLNFANYIFAVCTSWYLKANYASNDMKELLVLAVVIKHLYHPRFAQRSGGPAPDYDKLNRYYRAIYNNDDRGVIHCISRETNSFCDCVRQEHGSERYGENE